MPELPDVEAFRRVAAEHAVGRTVRTVEVTDAGVLRGVTAKRLRDTVAGHRFGTPRRHGKWLIVPFGGQEALLIHFGMTGSLDWSTGSDDRSEHDRIVFGLRNGELRYRDQRKLKGIRLVSGRAELDRELSELGPDALEVTRREFADRLTGSRRGIKSALTDQAVLAGLGNLLADEILWRGRIDPCRSCAELDSADVARLHDRMTTVLRSAVTAGRVPPRRSWLTGHRDEQGDVCPRCGTRLRHGRVNGRGTVWCPHCQPC
jgi:formamidopyrimidine-DNA glycosylase